MSEKPCVNIVLVQPQIPQNTGNIARTCAVTGAALHLVGPMGFTITDAKLKRAGLDYWDKLNITHYDNLDEFMLTHCAQVIPAVGGDNPTDTEHCVMQKVDAPLIMFTTKAKRIYTQSAYPQGCYLMFGREDAGLPKELLQAHQQCLVRLPMRNDLRSLNLSNTVAIAVYEALRQQGFEGLG